MGELFEASINEKNIIWWFSANKLSVNMYKAKGAFLHKTKRKYQKQLRLPVLQTNESGKNGFVNTRIFKHFTY